MLVATRTAMLEQTVKSSGLSAKFQKLHIDFPAKLGMVAACQILTMKLTR